MVFRSIVGELLEVMRQLSYVYERSRIMDSDSITTPVKGKNFILYSLNRCFPSIEYYSKLKEMSHLRDSVKYWIDHFTENYGEPPQQEKLIDLSEDDAKKIMEDSEKWRNTIITFFKAGSTELIKEESIKDLFPKKKYSKLDKNVKIDLNQGITCILHKQPTPAAMILFRAAEGMVRVYYKNLMGKSPSKLDWWTIIGQLEKTNKLKHSVIGYLHYIRDKRNEAQHPEKHFTQKESEAILLKIRDLIDEIV